MGCRQGGPRVGNPIQAQGATTGSELLTRVAQGMRALRIGFTAGTLLVCRRAGDTDDLFRPAVVRLEFVVINGPICRDAKIAAHPHAARVKSMRFAREVQCCAPDAAHMVVPVYPPQRAVDHEPALTIPRAKLLPSRLDRLHRGKRMLTLRSRLLRKTALFPIGRAQTVVLEGVERRAGFKHYDPRSAPRQRPGGGPSAGARAYDYDVIRGRGHICINAACEARRRNP